MNAPVLHHEQRQQQTLTPRLQQAVRLLQLSSLDFALEMQQAMSHNPFLETDETENEDANHSPANEVSAEEHEADAIVGQIWEANGWSLQGNVRRSNGEHDVELSEITAAVETLREHLRGQILLLKVSPRDRQLMNTIVESGWPVPHAAEARRLCCE